LPSGTVEIAFDKGLLKSGDRSMPVSEIEYEMKDGKIAIVDEQAELIRSIFRRYLELSGVNELVRDLKQRNIRTEIQHLASGKTRGGIPFGRGALYYLLSNHFYTRPKGNKRVQATRFACAAPRFRTSTASGPACTGTRRS
jgi:hypothetical protein